MRKAVFVGVLLFGGVTFAFSDFLICVRILQSHELSDVKTLAACQQMKKSVNFSKFPNCVMFIKRQTSLSADQSVKFCTEINADAAQWGCLLKMNKQRPIAIQSLMETCTELTSEQIQVLLE